MASQKASTSREPQVASPQRWLWREISPWRGNGELKGEHFQRAPDCFTTEMAMARNFARRVHGELKGEDF